MRGLRHINFVLPGHFAGIVRNEAGKRRMLLRTEKAEVELKLPAALRKKIRKRLVEGMELVVAGFEEGVDTRRKRLVLKVEFPAREAAGPARVLCPLQVCTKKHCWRSGGQELWTALKRQLKDAGLQETISVESVHCLDNCKQGPNLTCQGELLERFTLPEVSELVRHVAEVAGTKQRPHKTIPSGTA